MLVVIAIIATLAALTFGSMGGIKQARIKKRAASELAQVETAIESYKARMGYYPPADNSYTNPTFGVQLNSLYFELLGVTNNPANSICSTLDGSASIPGVAVTNTFGPNVGGILNCTRGGGGDEGGKAVPFIKTLTSGQFLVTPNASPYAVLGTALEGPIMITDSTFKKINPWRYRNPGLSNANSFDLWTVVYVGGRTGLVCNWSKTPLFTADPH
ncbi:MAG: hypothetical protein C5B50_29285 [Verrucomicrobia bacterium]|nr:MAG: hypothetical protein C5B50_29285 [Verrucomicrobiota bacterium]